MFNQVQSVDEVPLSSFPNKDVVAVNFLNWCEDKVGHIVARLLEMLSNRQAGTLVACLDNSVAMSHKSLLSCAPCLSCILRSAGACTSSSVFLGACAYIKDVGGLAVDLALDLDLLTSAGDLDSLKNLPWLQTSVWAQPAGWSHASSEPRFLTSPHSSWWYSCPAKLFSQILSSCIAYHRRTWERPQ